MPSELKSRGFIPTPTKTHYNDHRAVLRGLRDVFIILVKMVFLIDEVSQIRRMIKREK